MIMFLRLFSQYRFMESEIDRMSKVLTSSENALVELMRINKDHYRSSLDKFDHLNGTTNKVDGILSVGTSE